MFPLDVAGIVTRLRLDLEHLFQANNQLMYFGRAWPTAASLSMQIENRLYYCINDLLEIITEVRKWPSDAQFCGFGTMALYSPVPNPEPVRERTENHDPDLFKYLTVKECMELANVEHYRQSIIETWKFVEDQKRAFLVLAKRRKSQKDQ